MENLRTDSDYVAQLAEKQDEAATAFIESGTEAAGLGDAVDQTHGTVCKDSVAAVKDCERALNDVVAAMHSCSATLAERLRTAQAAYRNADSKAF
jgi:hypothetical protein